MNPLFIRNLGTWEILLILLVVLIIFGVGRLPEVGAGLGKGIRNFKKGIRGDEEDKEDPKDTGQNSSSTPKA